VRVLGVRILLPRALESGETRVFDGFPIPGADLLLGTDHPEVTWVRKLAVFFCLIGCVAAIYLGVTWPYWRNWLVWDMAAPDRAIDVDKYLPQQTVRGGESRSLELAPAGDRTLSTDAAQELEDLARETQSFAFLVSHGDQLQFSYYGNGVDATTLLDSYSMHKGLLALAFGYAVDRAYLESIDGPASQFIPEWRGDSREEITVRQLLNNESGLKRLQYSNFPYNPVLDFFIGRDLEELAFSAALDFPPGTAFEFNHFNSQVLHFVLVRSIGKSYAEILSEYLWQPLGNDTARVTLDHRAGAARTACCFLSTAPNWIRIGMLLNRHGRFGGQQVVSEAWIEEMMKPAPHNPNYGFNLWIGSPFSGRRLHSAVLNVYREITGPFAVSEVYFMEASGNGRLYFVPSKDVVIVRFGRRIADQEWDDGRTVNTVLRGLLGSQATRQ